MSPFFILWGILIQWFHFLGLQDKARTYYRQKTWETWRDPSHICGQRWHGFSLALKYCAKTEVLFYSLWIYNNSQSGYPWSSSRAQWISDRIAFQLHYQGGRQCDCWPEGWAVVGSSVRLERKPGEGIGTWVQKVKRRRHYLLPGLEVGCWAEAWKQILLRLTISGLWKWQVRIPELSFLSKSGPCSTSPNIYSNFCINIRS